MATALAVALVLSGSGPIFAQEIHAVSGRGGSGGAAGAVGSSVLASILAPISLSASGLALAPSLAGGLSAPSIAPTAAVMAAPAAAASAAVSPARAQAPSPGARFVSAAIDRESAVFAAATDGVAPADLRAELDARFDGSAARSFWEPALAAAVLVPLSSSVHELGHYLAARASGRSARIKVEKVRITDFDSLSYPRQLMISVAGPAFNFLFAAVAAVAALAQVLPSPLAPILWAYMGANAFFGVTNLLPFKARGIIGEAGVSDGSHARDEWRAWRKALADKEGLAWKDLAILNLSPRIVEPSVPMAPLAASAADAEKIGLLTQATLALAPRYAALSAGALRDEAESLKRRRRRESSEALLPEAFALAREAMARTLGKRPYPEQVAAAVAVSFGRAVEQKTGEGKTLSIGLAAFLGSLDGSVDVYTFNPYLAVRDADEIGRPLGLLGVSVGALEGRDESYLFSGSRDRARHASERALARVSRAELYRKADIVYGHTNGFIFDHLFDQDAASRREQTRRGRAKSFAIVDEVDAAMMEEADNDFRIVSRNTEQSMDYAFVYALSGKLKAGEDFTLDEKRGEVVLLPKALKFLEVLRASDPGFARWKHLPLYLRNALKARHLLTLDRDYAVVKELVVILDPHTGRLMHGRSWEDGLHRFVEVKEGLSPSSDYRLSSHMSLDAYFRLYGKVSGLSGTLGGTDGEFQKAYRLPIVGIPEHRPSLRVDRPARLYRTEKAKLEAIIAEALAARTSGRPVLIGAQDVAESARLARMLADLKQPFELLNGMQADEKKIVSAAGRPGAITIATQVAGRGTDIRPARPALEAGGLLVLLTAMSASRRVDLQYRGRAGRQGEPGETAVFVSLEDELLSLRASDEERALLSAAIIIDGVAVSGASADTLQAVQDRVESEAASGRDSRRLRDERLAPWREDYFKRRALLRRLRLPGAGLVLKALHQGWGDFLAGFEESWRASSSGPSPQEAEQSYRTLVLRSSWKALSPFSMIPTVSAGAYGAVSGFFEGSFYGKSASFLRRRLASPLWVSARVAAARFAETLRLRALAIRLLRGVLDDAPGRWSSRHRLAALLYARRDYSGAAEEFVNLLESLWKPKGDYSDQERRTMNWAIDNLAISFEARGRSAVKPEQRASRAKDLRLAYELAPSAESKAAADAALAPLSEGERAVAELTPPFMRVVYLDKARSAIDSRSYENARIYFDRVIEMAPDSATAFIGRSYARQMLKDEVGASSDILESLRLRIVASRQFGNMRLAYSLAEGASLNIERLEEAFAALGGDTPAESLPPQASAAERKTARVHAQAAGGVMEENPRQALNYAEAAVRSDPRLSDAYDQRGGAHFALGQYRQAYQDFADSLLWEFLDHDGQMGRLIAGHATVVNWKPSAEGMAAFVLRLKAL